MSLFEFDQEEYDRNRFEEGKAVGVMEGEASGIAKGERNKALQAARNLKQENIPAEIIAKCTGLPLEQIKML